MLNYYVISVLEYNYFNSTNSIFTCTHLCRYAGTVSSNIFVFLVTWILISTEGQGSERVTRSDSTAFTVS